MLLPQQPNIEGYNASTHFAAPENAYEMTYVPCALHCLSHMPCHVPAALPCKVFRSDVPGSKGDAAHVY